MGRQILDDRSVKERTDRAAERCTVTKGRARSSTMMDIFHVDD